MMKQKTNQEKRGQILFSNVFIVFILASLVVFCIDGFLLHPIPSQGYGVKFDLSKTDTAYANADVLYNDDVNSHEDEILLVEQDGQRHLIMFSRHRQTGRYAFREDVIVEPDFTGHVTLHSGIIDTAMWFENGEIVNRSGGGQFAHNGGPYMGIAMIFTTVESLILWKFLKKKYPNE